MVNSEIESIVDAMIIKEGSVRILIDFRINTTSTLFGARLRFEKSCNVKAITRVSSEILLGIADSKFVRTGVKIGTDTRTKAIIVCVCVKIEIDRISTKNGYQISIGGSSGGSTRGGSTGVRSYREVHH